MFNSWSNWALSNWQSCQEYFRRIHIERDFKQRALAATRGSCVHSVVHASMDRKMNGGEPFSPEEAADYGENVFNGKIAEGVRYDPKEVKTIGIAKAKAKALEEVVVMSAHHAKVLAPTVNPVAIEKKIIIQPKNFDARLTCVIDLVDRQEEKATTFREADAHDEMQGPPEIDVVRDLKTKAKSPDKNDAVVSQQLTFQAMAYRADPMLGNGSYPAELGLDSIWLTEKGRTPKHRFDGTTRNSDDVGLLLRRVQMAHEKVKTGIFEPAEPGHWKCSARWCEYHSECPYGERKRVQS